MRKKFVPECHVNENFFFLVMPSRRWRRRRLRRAGAHRGDFIRSITSQPSPCRVFLHMYTLVSGSQSRRLGLIGSAARQLSRATLVSSSFRPCTRSIKSIKCARVRLKLGRHDRGLFHAPRVTGLLEHMKRSFKLSSPRGKTLNLRTFFFLHSHLIVGTLPPL